MTEKEQAVIRELLAALSMISNGLSTDVDHYRRLDRAIDETERLLKRHKNKAVTPV